MCLERIVLLVSCVPAEGRFGLQVVKLALKLLACHLQLKPVAKSGNVA